MKATITISLTPALRRWVEGQIDQGGYGTAEEFFRQLIHRERKRLARLRVEERVLEALGSGPPRA